MSRFIRVIGEVALKETIKIMSNTNQVICNAVFRLETGNGTLTPLAANKSPETLRIGGTIQSQIVNVTAIGLTSKKFNIIPKPFVVGPHSRVIRITPSCSLGPVFLF